MQALTFGRERKMTQELKLNGYAIVATDENTGEAYCKTLSDFEATVLLGLIADDSGECKFRKVHSFELRGKK